MERVNVVVLASLAAALVLLVLRLFAPGTAPDFTEPSSVAAMSRRDSISDHLPPPSRLEGSRDGSRAAQPPEPGAPPPGEERRGGRGGSGVGGRSAQLIAGAERRRDVLGAAQGRGSAAADESAAAVGSDILAGRTGAVPPARGNGRGPTLPEADPNKRQTLEFVDEPPKANAADDVLLKLPFKGDVTAEVGGGPVVADGLVSKGGQVEFPDEAQLSFPVGGNVNSNAGTISFQVQPQWAGADETNNSLVQIRDEHIWENELEIVKNFGALRYIIIDSGGVERNVNIPIDDWPAGEARQVTATWDESTMALYVNGELVGENTFPNPLKFSDTTPIHIGSDFPGASYLGAGGTISDFTVYGRVLAAEELARR